MEKTKNPILQSWAEASAEERVEALYFLLNCYDLRLIKATLEVYHDKRRKKENYNNCTNDT